MQRGGRPPSNAGRVTGEILAGGALGTLLGSGGALLGVQIAWDEFHDDLHEHGEYVVLIGWATGSLLGSTIGVYAVGNIGDQTGPFSAALGGSIVGTLIGATGFLMAWAIQGDALYPIAVLALACPSVSATIGFNLRRRYESPPAESETALINVRDGQISFAIPRIRFQTDCTDGGGLRQSINLLRVRF